MRSGILHPGRTKRLSSRGADRPFVHRTSQATALNDARSCAAGAAAGRHLSALNDRLSGSPGFRRKRPLPGPPGHGSPRPTEKSGQKALKYLIFRLTGYDEVTLTQDPSRETLRRLNRPANQRRWSFMRCAFCDGMGFVSGPSQARPCPECGGCGIAHCCDGLRACGEIDGDLRYENALPVRPDQNIDQARANDSGISGAPATDQSPRSQSQF